MLLLFLHIYVSYLKEHIAGKPENLLFFQIRKLFEQVFNAITGCQVLQQSLYIITFVPDGRLSMGNFRINGYCVY